MGDNGSQAISARAAVPSNVNVEPLPVKTKNQSAKQDAAQNNQSLAAPGQALAQTAEFRQTELLRKAQLAKTFADEPATVNRAQPAPDETQRQIENYRRVGQAQADWQGALRSAAPDAKVFDFKLKNGILEQEQNFYAKTYTEAHSLLGTGNAQGLDRFLQPHGATLEAMGRIANLPVAAGAPPDWKAFNQDERIAAHIQDLGQKHPPGTKFALVAVTSRGVSSFPYNPNPDFSQYRLAIAVTPPGATAPEDTKLLLPGLEGIGARPNYYPTEIGGHQIVASIDATHLTGKTKRPAEVQATVNIAGADALTNKNQNLVKQNYDKFVAAQFAPYLHLRGDAERELAGASLINEIGMSLRKQPNNEPATPAQTQELRNGTWEFYKGEERQQIGKIADSIRQIGGNNPRVTVLPLMLDAKLPEGNGTPKQIFAEIPLFRVIGERDGKEYFVDDTGRTYPSFDDWKQNNQLPAGRVTAPADGRLSADASNKPVVETLNTPAVVDTTWEKIKPWLDGAALVGGVIVAGFAIAGTGGLAVPIAGAVIAGYGAANAGGELYDRYSPRANFVARRSKRAFGVDRAGRERGRNGGARRDGARHKFRQQRRCVERRSVARRDGFERRRTIRRHRGNRRHRN